MYISIRQHLFHIALAGASLFTASLGLFIATPAFATTTPQQNYHVMVMTHLCKISIQNADQFDAMENGLSPLAALATDVLACPTTGLPNNTAATGSIAAPRTTYNFSIMTGAQTQTVQANGTFMPKKVCESNLNMDVNKDGLISSSTCLDISDYDVPVIPSSSDTQISVDQTMSPAGFHFGTLRFTPVALDGNNDSESLKFIDPKTGHMHLNMIADKDRMIMLHVYQFMNASTTGNGGTGTTTTDGGAGTTTRGLSSSAFSNAIRASVQAQIQSIRLHILNLLNANIQNLGSSMGSTSMNSTSSMNH